jgi:hypothetical protein
MSPIDQFMLETNFAVFELAYVGPGAGLTMIGALLAVICVILMAVLAPVIYCVRTFRLWWQARRLRSSVETAPFLPRRPPNE